MEKIHICKTKGVSTGMMEVQDITGENISVREVPTRDLYEEIATSEEKYYCDFSTGRTQLIIKKVGENKYDFDISSPPISS